MSFPVSPATGGVIKLPRIMLELLWLTLGLSLSVLSFAALDFDLLSPPSTASCKKAKMLVEIMVWV